MSDTIFYNQSFQEKDVSNLLNLRINEFITMIYQILLDREPNREEFSKYIRYLCQGAPREAMIYLISLSTEFSNRYNIINLSNYKKIYKIYSIKAKIKKLPFVGWFFLFQKLPDYFSDLHIINSERQLRELILENEISFLKINIQQILESLKFLTSTINEKINTVNEKINTVNEKINMVETIMQETNNLKLISSDTSIRTHNICVKLDFLNSQLEPPFIKEYMIVNGSLDYESYLSKANSMLKKTFPEQLVEGNYYQLLETLFRGSEKNIKKLQRFYLKYLIKNNNLKDIKGTYFLDAGCGRGEFLKLLNEYNIPSVGIDINNINVNSLIKKKFHVYCTDILEYLDSIEDRKLIGLSSFQVIEHLSKEYVKNLINISSKKISNGGVILLETLNPFCYINHGNFYIDPTHVSWHSPDNLKLNLEYAGFSNVKIIYSIPVHHSHASKVDFRFNYVHFAIVGTLLG